VTIQAREVGVVTSSFKMPAKQVGAVYLVDCECFSAAEFRKYRDTLENNKTFIR
jgi:hypothetical protein